MLEYHNIGKDADVNPQILLDILEKMGMDVSR